jgi:hypothetical protein
MGKSVAIKNAVVELLTGLQYKGEPAFAHVTDSTADDFKAYPIVRVLPQFVDNDKDSFSQMNRGVNLQVVVFLKLEDSTRIQGQTIDQMLDLTDILLDTLDEGDDTNALETIDPSLNTYIMKATRADWDPVDSKGGAMLMLVIAVEVSYLKELSNGVG